MRFLCLVYFKAETLAALSPSEKATLTRDSMAYNDELRQRNHYIAAEALEPVRNARTIRVRRGKASVTDGPFAETKEVVGGFILIDAAGMDEALKIAAGIPLAKLGSIEVRPVMHGGGTGPHTAARPGRSNRHRPDRGELTMAQTLGHVTLVVRDYDEALTFFTYALGFRVIEDIVLGDGKRWILVGPPNSRGTSLLLAQASTTEEVSHIGNQTGGRVFLFLHTDDFWRDYVEMKARNVKFNEKPREEAYGTVAVFEDLDGNKWDLLELKDNSGSI